MANVEQTHMPPFNMETSQMSDEAFKKHVSFLKLPLARDEFSDGMWDKLERHGIHNYKTFFSKDIGLEHRYYEGYFSFKVIVLIVYSEEQLELLQ